MCIYRNMVIDIQNVVLNTPKRVYRHTFYSLLIEPIRLSAQNIFKFLNLCEKLQLISIPVNSIGHNFSYPMAIRCYLLSLIMFMKYAEMG